MKEINTFMQEQLDQLERQFKQSMSRSFEILGADGFRFDVGNVNRRPINMALFEALAYFFTLVDIAVADRGCLKQSLVELKRNFDDDDFCFAE